MNEDSVEFYGAFYLGALTAANAIFDDTILDGRRPADRPYREAEKRLITKSKRAMQLFLQGETIRYRHHKYKNGRLIGCEAYFADRKGNELRIE